jgi:hypothetical protein
VPNVSRKREEYLHPKNRRKVSFILESLLVATVLSLFIVGITFVLVPSTVTVKTLLSLTSVTLIYPAVYSVARRTEPRFRFGVESTKQPESSNNPLADQRRQRRSSTDHEGSDK